MFGDRASMAGLLNIVLTIISITTTCECSHFRGAMIYWKQSPTDKNVIDIDYRQAWRRSALSPPCDDDVKANGTLMSDGDIRIASRSSFLSDTFDIAEEFDFQCTDYSILEDWTSGKGHVNFTPSAIDNAANIFFVSFRGAAWIGSIHGRSGDWSLLAVINTTQRMDTGRMNQSPRVDMAPIIRLQHGCNHTIRIPVSDVDGDDIRCRWAESTVGKDECASVCHMFFHATIDEHACTITYNAQYDTGYYAVAVQIEDFSSPTSNTFLSSIPLQFLVSVEGHTSCQTFKKERPTFGITPLTDQACIGVRNGTEFSADIYINSKSNSSITELNTISPIGLLKSSLEQVNSSAGTWHVRLTWNPSNTDTVNNVLCFTAVDANGLSSEQRCVTLLAGVPPAEILPQSKTPSSSVVPTTQQHWSIEFDKYANPASRPAFIYLSEANGRLVETIDVSNATRVTFTNGSHGTVLQFTTTTALQPGHEYYFQFGQGLVHGDSYCGAGSSAELNSSFWRFTVESGPVTSQVQVVCERQAVPVPCDETDSNCIEQWQFPNPCTPDNLLAGKTRFAHPTSTHKFLLCDLVGKVYIALCPQDEIFYTDTNQCAAPGTGQSDPCSGSPTTGQTLFPHCDPHKYIHCGAQGQMVVQSCQMDYLFLPGYLTCVPPGSHPGMDSLTNTCHVG